MTREEYFKYSDRLNNLGKVLSEKEIVDLYDNLYNQNFDAFRKDYFYERYDIWDIIETIKKLESENNSKNSDLINKLNTILNSCQHWDAKYTIKPYNLVFKDVRDNLVKLNQVYDILKSKKCQYSKALEISKIFVSSSEFKKAIGKLYKNMLKDRRLLMGFEALSHYDEILNFYLECEKDRRNLESLDNKNIKKGKDTIFNDVLYYDSKSFYYPYFTDARNTVIQFMEYGFNSFDNHFFSQFGLKNNDENILSKLICAYIDTDIYNEIDNFMKSNKLISDVFAKGIELITKQNHTNHANELNEYLTKYNFTENKLLQFENLIKNYINTDANRNLNQFLKEHGLLNKKNLIVECYAKQYGCDKIYDFLRSISMTESDFSMCCRIVDELDVDLYNNYQSIIRFNEKVAIVANKAIFNDLAFGIENHSLPDGTDFNILVFLKKLPFKYSSDCHKLIKEFLKKHCSQEVYTSIIKYLGKIVDLNYFKNFDSLSIRKDIYAIDTTISIDGNLIEISEQDKANVLTYLDKNSIPVCRQSFNYVIEMYLNGKLDINKPFTYVKK